jgi:hypothetical protein
MYSHQTFIWCQISQIFIFFGKKAIEQIFVDFLIAKILPQVSKDSQKV